MFLRKAIRDEVSKKITCFHTLTIFLSTEIGQLIFTKLETDESLPFPFPGETVLFEV